MFRQEAGPEGTTTDRAVLGEGLALAVAAAAGVPFSAGVCTTFFSFEGADAGVEGILTSTLVLVDTCVSEPGNVHEVWFVSRL